MKVVKIVRYETFIVIGIVVVLVALIKLLGIYNFSSTWFWFLIGIGLIIEGTISLIKQRKFDKKYKIVEKEEEK